MYTKMFEKYSLNGDNASKIMIIQKKDAPSSPDETVHKVILAWFMGESDVPYQYSVTHMYNKKNFGNGKYFLAKYDENALKYAIEAYNDICF